MHSLGSTLPVTFLRTLTLAPAQHPKGLAHMSAASGLVRVLRRLYVVADDELHLGLFDDIGPSGADAAPGALLRLFEGDLPLQKEQRKATKPDLETLALLPPLPGCPAGALLALGSGSKPQRETGVLLALDAQGAPTGHQTRIDLAPLYAPLRTHFADLNVEGALLVGDELLLLQRGNQDDARSACIRYAWPHVADWLAGAMTGTAAEPPAPRHVQPLVLGTVDGVPLAFTDGTPLHGGAWAFCAVAEATDNSYQDGRCVASAIGIVAPDGQMRQLHLLQGAPKVEGIAAQWVGNSWQFTMVTDPDDRAIAAQLLQATLGHASTDLLLFQ